MMRSRTYIPYLIPLILCPLAVFGTTADQLLQKAEMADKHVNYRGTKIATFQFSGHPIVSKFKVIHVIPDLTRTEFFTPDQLSGIILIQDGSQMFKFSPKDKEWEESGCKLVMPSDIVYKETIENYNLKVIGTDKVAGRPTYVIYAEPKSATESARRVWIDKTAFLVMRTQVESPHGLIVNSSRFITIDMNPPDISKSSFKIIGKIKPQPKKANPQFTVVKPSYLPKGYALIAVSSLSVNGCCSAHLQYSNGANVLSLFQKKADKDAPITVVSNRATKVITWAHNGIQFTLIGDISISELKKIANSTR